VLYLFVEHGIGVSFPPKTLGWLTAISEELGITPAWAFDENVSIGVAI
jgi:hypothetical protein